MVGVTKDRQTPRSRFTDDASESAARASFCLVLSDQLLKSVATTWLLTMLQGSWFMPRSDVDQRHYIDNTEMFTDDASRVV